MADKQLIHDTAAATAEHIIEYLGAHLTDDQLQEAFGEVYERVKAGLEAFTIEEAKIRQRIGPSRN